MPRHLTVYLGKEEPRDKESFLWVRKNDNEEYSFLVFSGESWSPVDTVLRGTGNPSILLGGLNNQAVSQGSVSFGIQNTAGIKGWYYKKIDFEACKIYLSEKQVMPSSGVSQPEPFRSNFIVGNNLVIINGDRYYYVGRIVDISGNCIEVESLPFSMINIKSDLNIDDYSCFSIETPDAGGVDLAPSAVCFGEGCEATARQAFASGIGSQARGIASFASCGETIAEGDYSHAEGQACGAGGKGSHAEGIMTTAREAGTHAEGFHSIAGTDERPFASVDDGAGKFSHAEGGSTWAPGNASHSEGVKTQALGRGSHSEGIYTIAGSGGVLTSYNRGRDGDFSHAEGISTYASGKASHTEGQHTNAGADCAHAEGYSTAAAGDYSHAEGYNTVTNNTGEHAEGKFNYSSGGDAFEKSIHSVGVGSSDSNRKNAYMITTNGEMYICGVGGYNGKNVSSAKSLQSVLEDLGVTIDWSKLGY